MNGPSRGTDAHFSVRLNGHMTSSLRESGGALPVARLLAKGHSGFAAGV